MNLVKERTWPIKRNGQDFVVVERGDSHKVMRAIRGGATAATPQSQAQQAAAVLSQFLSIAPTKFYAITGTVPSGSSGGGNATVVWSEQIPIVPAFCVAIDYEINLPVTLTLGANTGAATVSPFAPYSAFQNGLTLGGAPPWPFTELTPWHLDESFHRTNYDAMEPGLSVQQLGLASSTQGSFLGVNSGTFPTILDFGPSAAQVGGTGSLAPGQTVTNVTTAAVATNYVWQFTVRQVLKRKRHLLWGAIPFGDPENRPNNRMQLGALIGNNPEQNLFVAVAGATTAVLNGVATVKAIYHLAYIDLLPPSMGQAPAPAVGYGLQLTPSSPGPQQVGNIYKITHRTAQIYTDIHELLINGVAPGAGGQFNGNQMPIRADYFGLWDDQDQQSARWSFDAQVNTFQEYFTKFHRDYRRYPATGHYMVAMDDGEFPEVPSVTPYQGLMTPDASYAQAFNIPVTPAMTTAIRIPAGTTNIASPYVRVYEFGLVRVPY